MILSLGCSLQLKSDLSMCAASVCLQVFWLPPDSEEKISLSITVLLAFSVFQFVVTDLTPTSSDSTPIIGISTLVIVLLSSSSSSSSSILKM